jgi:hypothetical protein
LPVRFISQHIQRTIRSNPHITNSLISVFQNAPIFAHAITVNAQDNDRFLLQRTDKEFVFPLRVDTAVIERHAAHGRGHFPDKQRRLGSFDMLTLRLRDFQPAVINSVCCQRPAVVFAFFRNIDLISATRAMLIEP